LKSFASPTKGWVSAQNLAAAVPGTALMLENWYPTQTSIKLRGGSQLHATIGTDPCETLMAYVGTTRKLFASDETNIFEVTAPVDPEVPPAADVTGQTSGYYGWTNFATPGGFFLYAVNGTDSAQLYNGTAWTTITGISSPAITGVTTSTLSHVWTYRNRVFFIQGGTTEAWALPVDSIGGAAIQISLGGVFRRGGTLLLGARWSLDAGDGLDDKCIFMTTEGEVAVYQGSDPSDPTDWSLVGVYDMPPPMGRNATMSAGGDLLILTEQGFIPISAAINRDPAALPFAAVSKAIEPDWVSDARQRRSMPWEVAKWPLRSKAIISTPVTGDESTTPPQCYVVNLETGAWCKYTGWDTRTLVLHDDFVYFGTNSGTVFQAEITGSDNGELIYHNCVLSFDHFDRVGQYKTAVEMRATFLTQNTFLPKLSVSTDYSVNLASPPNATTSTESPGEWDVGLWDVAQWDTGIASFTTQTYWSTVGLSGTVHAPQLQVTSGSETTPTAELVIIDVKIDDGDDTGS
jgi:hypothetical protein